MRVLTLTLLLALSAPQLAAQPGAPAGAPRFAPAEQAGSQPARGPRNIRLDLTITDTYTGEVSVKTVTMLIESGQNGMIRTSNRLPSGHSVGLNVDALAQLVSTSSIRVRVTFEYTPAQTAAEADVATDRTAPAQLHESLSVILQNGEKLTVSQSADPATDRKVTVELTATLM